MLRHAAKTGIQDKREYSSAQTHTKIAWTEAEIFLNLVVEEAHVIALNEETKRLRPVPSARTMAVRWVSYLILVSHYGSFPLVVALIKILYDAGPNSTAAAQAVLDLIQPGNNKDLTQFPNRTRIIMTKLRERFEHAVCFITKPTGKIDFVPAGDSHSYSAVIKRLLGRLVPVEAQIPQLPPDLSSCREIKEFTSRNDAAERNTVEKSRVAALLKPNGLEQILASLGFPPLPLVVPAFAMSNFPTGDGGVPDSGDGGDFEVSEEQIRQDIEELRNQFRQAQSSRHKAPAMVLEFEVDGALLGEINALESVVASEHFDHDSTSFWISEQARRLDVYDHSTEQRILLLAVDLPDLVGDEVVLCSKLGCGQEISVELGAVEDGAVRIAKATFRETVWWRRWLRNIRRAPASPRREGPRTQNALAFTVMSDKRGESQKLSNSSPEASMPRMDGRRDESFPR
jgi:hypothetical protein